MDEQERLYELVVRAAFRRRMIVKRAREHVEAGRPEPLPGGKLRADHVLAFNDKLTRLEKEHARLAQIIELRFFGGATDAEVGMVLGFSERTAKREWAVGRVWMHQQLNPKSE